MNVVIQQLNTSTMTIEYICKALLDIKAQEDGYNTTIKLSLDLTRPEFVSATKLTNPEHGAYFHCEYNRLGRVIFTADVYPKTVITDVNIMLKAVEKQIKDEELEDMCYKAYQLDWMMSHGCSLEDVYDILKGSLVDQIESDEEVIESGRTMENFFECAVEEFLNEHGFGRGLLFAGKNEFLEAEFRDTSYMMSLIKRMKDSAELEKRYIAKFLPEWKSESA